MSNKTKAYIPKNEPLNFWRTIPGTKGIYQINREGDIRRIWKSGKVTDIKPQKSFSKKEKIIRLTLDGKRKEYTIQRLMMLTWVGPRPKGMVIRHINGEKYDSHLENLEYVSREELGKKTGHRSNSQAVFKIDSEGNEIEVYRSAREAARNNYMSYQTVMDRCNHKVKSEFALSSYSFRWAKELERE